MLKKQSMLKSLFASLFAMILTAPAYAGEASLVVPNIKAENPFSYNLLMIGLIVSVIGVIFGVIEFLKLVKLILFSKVSFLLHWKS